MCYLSIYVYGQSHKAPASLSKGTRLPPRCSDMTLSVEPISRPPIKTAGTGGLLPNNFINAFSISAPRGSWSRSQTTALAPRSWNRLFTLQVMQHELKLKMTTARCEANVITLSMHIIVTKIVGQWLSCSQLWDV